MTSKLPRQQEDGDIAPEVFQHDSAPEVVRAEKEVYRIDEHRLEYYGDSKGGEGQQSEEPQPKRVCGLRRRTFLWLALAAVLVVIAVVLGATLSQVLKSGGGGDTSDAPSPAASPIPSAGATLLAVKEGSGIGAIASATQGQTYGYYQDENNAILEAEISDDTWQSPEGTTTSDNVVTNDAAPSSPLSALRYTLGGVEYRILFYISVDNRLSTTNRTSSGTWSTPKVILTDTEAPLEAGSIALDAFVVPDWQGSNAIRVYYGSVSEGIREVGWGHLSTASASGWAGDASGPFLTYGDSSTGVGATSSTDKSLNIYLKNSSTALLTQWNFGYSSLNTHGWQMVAEASGVISPAVGTAITACTDQVNGVDYIFFQGPARNMVMRTADTVPSDSSRFGSMQVLEPVAAYGSKLRCVYDSSSGGSVTVYYQDEKRQDQLSYLRTNADGTVLDAGVVTT